MGRPIAERLVQAGVPLVVTNRTEARSAPLRERGATVVASPDEVGRWVGSGVAFLMVSDGAAVRQALFGPRGLSRTLRRGALVVDLSTIGPEESRRHAARLGRRGVQYLDAPVGGSVEAAASGSLTVFVGGDPAAVERVRPLFAHFARSVEPMGRTGSGSSMKLVNNLLTVGYVALASEALAFGQGLGLERGRMIDLLLAGGGRSAMLERKRSQLAERRYDAQFRLALALKDLKLIERSGRGVRFPTRLTREVRRLVDEAMAAGHAEEDFTSVLEAALGRRGTQPGVEPAGELGGAAPPEPPG